VAPRWIAPDVAILLNVRGTSSTWGKAPGCRRNPGASYIEVKQALLEDGIDIDRLPALNDPRNTDRLTIEHRAPLVEVQHPVPDDLKTDPADLRRLGARRAVIDRCDAPKSRRNGIGADMTNLLGSSC
jgi:hypothetical protein